MNISGHSAWHSTSESIAIATEQTQYRFASHNGSDSALLSNYSALINQSRDAICVVDQQHRIIHISDEFTPNFRPSGNNCKYTTIESSLGNLLYTSIKRDLAIAFDGKSSTASRWGVDEAGEPQQFVLTFIPLFDQQSSVFAVLIICIDAIAGKLDNAQSIKSGEGCNSFDSEWHWEMDEQLRFSYVSSNIALSTDYDVDWFIGKTRTDVIAANHGKSSFAEVKDTLADKHHILSHLETIENHAPFENFIYSVNKAGYKRWLSISGFPLYSQDEQKRFLGYRGIGRDITTVREALDKHVAVSTALETFSNGFAVFTADGKLAQCNGSFLDLLSLDSGDVPENCDLEVLLDGIAKTDDFSASRKMVGDLLDHIRKNLASERSRCEWKNRRGEWRRLSSETGQDGLLILEICDVTQEKKAEQQIGDDRNLLRALINSIPDAIYALDMDLSYVAANARIAEYHGKKHPDEIIGKKLSELSFSHGNEEIIREEHGIIRSGTPLINKNKSFIDEQTQEKKTFSISKVPLRNDNNEIIGLVGHAKDITSLHRLTEQLAHQAEHDELTGLINRRGFSQRLDQARDDFRLAGQRSVVCFIDLDQFKIVNDTVGHKAGDLLLRQISVLIAQNIRESDTLARLGGDEFGLILHGCSTEKAMPLVQAVIDEINQFRFNYEDKLFELGASVGMVEINAVTQTAESILSQADVACYTAKDLGRRRYHVFSQDDSESVRRQNQLEQAADIRNALEENRFVLYTQPIASAHSSGLVVKHVEALVRMLGRDGELISPAAFIPAAERFELMAAIDRWVIQHVLENYAEVFGHHNRTTIAINLSGNSLNDSNLAQFVQHHIKANQVNPECLCFELTETAYISNLAIAQSFISELRSIGCAFALDDFGSGLSSFAYLKNFKVDYLKIDGGFVRNIIDDAGDKAMVSAINDVGHALGIKTIAEFVETESHIDVLTEMGVDYLQGYGIAKPTPMLS